MVSDDDEPLERADLTFLLGMSFQLLHQRFFDTLVGLGYGDLRPVHGIVFQMLHGEGATSTELAERLGVTKQATGQIVDYLESHGYVRRQPHPEGGRRRLVVLTDKAIGHLIVAGRVLYDLESQLGDEIGGVDLQTVRHELARLIRGMAGNTIPPLRPVW